MAALIVTGAAIWLASVVSAAWVWAAVALALVASAAWVAMGFRARRRLADSERHRLVLARDALTLVEGDRERQIPWGAVDAIATDEERLVVRIDVHEGERLDIEPRYGGLGAYDLERTIRRARDAATEDGA